MKKIVLLLSIFLVGAVLWACGSKSVPVEKPSLPETAPQPQATIKEPREIKREETLRQAEKEGKVRIYSFLAVRMREELGKGFKNRFGLDVEWTTGSGTELVQKILTERRAGLSLADMALFGATEKISALKPAGLLDPIEPELLLPEVTDTSKWLNNELPQGR